MFRPSITLWVILAVALVLRVGAAVGVTNFLQSHGGRDFVISGDAEGYWELGRRLASGESYAVHEPPRHALRMPGFPAVLAVSMKLFGESFLAARLVLACLGTGVCGLVYWFGQVLFDETVGLIAAGVTALSPPMVLFSVMILSETLFAFGMIASLIAMARLVRGDYFPGAKTPFVGWSIAAGVLIAVACYFRPTWVLAGPAFVFFGMFVANRRREAILAGTLMTAAALVCLLPWGVRNRQVTGHFVLTTLWVGPSLYDGLNPEATGASNMAFFDREQLPRTMSEYEVDRHYRAEAVKYARENPGRALSLAVAKLVRFWKPWPNAVQFDNLWARLAMAGYFLPVMILAGVGLAARRRDLWGIVLTVGPVLYFALVHAVFIGSLRYRLPAEYALCVLSAVGAAAVWTRLRGGTRMAVGA